MTVPATVPTLARCSDAARLRDDPLLATAPPARRLFLVELPGPWGRTGLVDSRFDHYLAGRLADLVETAGARLLLIRRPGRTDPDRSRSWALADIAVGDRPGTVHWGTWEAEHDLLTVDLSHPAAPEGQQRVALVCAHGRHDVCCAVRGRSVAQAMESLGTWDVWESSHVGGCRFAANALLLPTGDLFGRLDPASALTTLAAAGEGRVTLDHYRGRYGRPAVEQAARHLALAEVGSDRDGDITIISLEETEPAEAWRTTVRHGADEYLLALRAGWSQSDVLTCGAAAPSRARRFILEEMIGPVRP